METCYKVFRREVIQSIDLRENRFGFEPEVTGETARARLPHLRSRHFVLGADLREGKKIGWRDGVRAIWCILNYRARPALRAGSAVRSSVS